ncbi:RNA-guided endonuclease InsQ/TnpB family protein [Psychrobacter ciconiae]|uniref:RNA-guided endonuclease InsQ/TnpB family protein n=1 Tax=Psychrobacter ciconiae TaxID=1553449 RepID=UPI001919D2AC|nr:RNA-guided endonuclease TnpB family protein [Psychrobacter ciconiae]
MKTLKLRLKDKHAKQLNQLSSSVNFVWNYVNELSFKHLQRTGKFFSAYDLAEYTKGSGALLGLHSQTIQAISETHAKSRKQFKKAKLQWRTNNPKAKVKSLGWIPFKKSAIKHLATRQSGKKALKSTIQLSLAKGQKLIVELFDSYNLALYDLNTLELVQDARGRWYACITVKAKADAKAQSGKGQIGIDLGLKEAATTSDGDTLTVKQTQKWAAKLAIAQRAKNKKRAQAIHAKIKNTRKDLIHKFTTQLVKGNSLIVIGDLKSKSFTSTNLAKSTYDAGWFELKRQLDYKCKHAGCRFEIVNESYTTQTCSSCRQISDSSPKGRTGLRIREWTCECGVTHDRDINAARNILAVGLDRLAEGIPSL